jgi:hypothetical protein
MASNFGTSDRVCWGTTKARQLKTEKEALIMTITATEDLIEVEDPIEAGTPNRETLEAFRDIKEKRNLLGPYTSAEEMLRDFGIDVDI